MKILYRESHEWAAIEGNTAKVGISDHAQSELGDLVFVNLPEVGTEVTAGEVLCDVESVKAVSDLYAPVSGKIVKVNEELESSPELINQDAMGAWICEIEVTEVPEDLMDETAYEEFIK
ncbi:MAG: glycine cleavage system protein GcvH [Clostridiales bacterium]|nr:glycine cleavage system protein GcvH [Clostridiales bacterium]